MKVMASVICLSPPHPKKTGIGWRDYYEVELPDGQPITFDAVRDALADRLIPVATAWALESIYVKSAEDLPQHN